MFRIERTESGQISVLVLAISLAVLIGTCLMGAVAQVVVVQQRLNSKAESIALAGAQELEFNQAQACDVAREFSVDNFGLNANCISQPESIHVLISEPNPNPLLRTFVSFIYASSRAGVVAENSLDSVD
jgi:secretion/DNA translocation related TadE-like protein